MSQVVEHVRKTSVLKHPALPCLSRYHTINLLAGCPYRCRYCYTQSFRSHPGWNRIVFYANTLEMLERQLPRMRRQPGTVYFSTACEPFAPYPRVRDTLYRTMTLLLANSISLVISTKSDIPAGFFSLFEEYRDRVYVQVGLTTADDTIRQVLEPAAPCVSVRMATMAGLAGRGIPFDLRADPLIPDLTDSDDKLTELFRAAAAAGATRVAASYLFIRPANLGSMNPLEHGDWSFVDMYRRRYTETIENYCGKGSIRVAHAAYRRERYDRMSRLAGDHGLTLRLCRCKNPDVTDMCCHPTMPATPETEDRTLFDS